MTLQNKFIEISALVSCEWLQQNLDSVNQVILDATFFLPRQQRNALEEYHQQHIPEAQFFDIDEVADLTNPLSHMLPNAEHFSTAVGKMGISNNTLVLIYDNNNFFAAARVWWMFQVFGHNRVHVIDGGLTRWKQLNYPISSKRPIPFTKTFKVNYCSELVFNLEKMKLVVKSKSRQIVDTRSPDSFFGQRPLFDTTLQPGHIPDSINVPYADLTDSTQRTLLSNKTLHSLFEQAHINLSNPIVITCGSGVSAAVLALALYQIGFKNIPVYDGSWAEWGRQTDTPKHQSISATGLPTK
ncbi:MAG: rhodanese-like domain-containing protein [Methylococcales bacterium]|nr:rhodanese-like domain-containing protein [Methylococcales bacterium]